MPIDDEDSSLVLGGKIKILHNKPSQKFVSQKTFHLLNHLPLDVYFV